MIKKDIKALEEQFQSVFHNDYPGYNVFVQKVISPIFGKDYSALSYPENMLLDTSLREDASRANIIKFERIGEINSLDSNPIEVFDVTLNNSCQIARSRVGIQRIVRRQTIFEHSFILFHYEDPKDKDWRFSYVYKGGTQKETTDAKRYTYVFGKDYMCNTAKARFAVLANSAKTDEDITKAFSVEALSEKFFEEYRNIYAFFVQYITGKRYVHESGKWVESEPQNNECYEALNKDDKRARDFVKKMMGRITFLYFLQQKGWMCGDKNYMLSLYSKSTDKDQYLKNVLCPLFFGVLNTKPEDRRQLFKEKGWNDTLRKEWQEIPYLNGGLFDMDQEDKAISACKTPIFREEDFTKLFEFYSEYNFTIDENDPKDAEVGVDPEMLGKIFESLLEDNKEKGAYYTPKEIVQYMCKESLSAYLCSKVSGCSSKIQQFVQDPTETVHLFSKKEIEDLKLSICNVKICDPAIGSGAFPMGLLKELVHCKEALYGEDKDRAAIKEEIIRNNIYGVDIEKGAVDIARLRFWLALVVDNEKPMPLPNLDYKIMQGNSLIPTFNGKYVNLSDKLRHINSTKISNAKKELRLLQNDYFTSEGDIKKELLIKIKYLILEIVKLQMDYEYQAEVLQEAKSYDLFTQEVIPSKYKADDEKAKIVGLCINLQKYLNSPSKSLSERSSSPIPFFDWKIMFSDVFNSEINDGFDIVIANPPYLKERDNKATFDTIAGSSFEKKYHRGKMDYWYYFLHKGIELANKDATICFITSRYWIKSSGAKCIIKSVKDNLTVQKILDIGKLKVFDNVIGLHMVALYKKNIEDTPCKYFKLSDRIENLPANIFSEVRDIPQAALISNSFEINLEQGANTIIGRQLSDQFDVCQGVIEASDKISAKMYKKKPNPAFRVGDGIFVLSKEEYSNHHFSDEENANIVKYLGDGECYPFCICKEHTRYLIYADGEIKKKIISDSKFNNIKEHLDKYSTYISSSNGPYGLHRPREREVFEQNKIIGPSMFKSPSYAIDTENYFCGMSYNIITSKEGNELSSLFYLLGLLNSSFAEKWFYSNAKHRGVGVDVGVEKLREFPLPADNKNFDNIVTCVKTILSNLSNNISVDNVLDGLNNLVEEAYK